MKRTVVSFAITLAIATAASFTVASPAMAVATVLAQRNSPSQLVLDNSQRVLTTLEQRRPEFTKSRVALRQDGCHGLRRRCNRDGRGRGDDQGDGEGNKRALHGVGSVGGGVAPVLGVVSEPAAGLLPPPNMYLPTIWIRSTAGVVNAISSPGFKAAASPPGCRPM